jgi:iron(III) transport system substrate-binding protein
MEKRVFSRGVVIAVLMGVAFSVTIQAWAAEQTAIDAAKKEGKFVWYTSLPTEPAVDYLKAFQAKYPFINTSEFFRSPALNVLSRLETEYKAGKAICDVFHIAAIPPYLKMVRDGWLMKFDSPVYQKYPEGSAVAGYWAAFRCMAAIGGYNKEVVQPGDVPKTWKDLSNPKWRGKIGAETGGASVQAQIYYTLDKMYGKSYWDQMKANKLKVQTGAGAMTVALLRGEIEVAMCYYDYSVYEESQLKKSPIRGIWFEEGVPRIVSPQAIMKNAPHPNAAKLFQEWSLSEEGQMKMVGIIGAYSARPDIAPPKGLPALTEFKSLFVQNMEEFADFLSKFPDVWKGIVE